MISNTWKWHVIFPSKEKKDLCCYGYMINHAWYLTHENDMLSSHWKKKNCCYGYMINHALFTAEKSIEVILKDKTKEINVWCVISWLNLQTNLLVKLDQNNSKSIKILVQELVDLYQRFWSHSKKSHSCIIRCQNSWLCLAFLNQIINSCWFFKQYIEHYMSAWR